eukprot:3251874-Pyramimonas_sp.AAC.1
MSHTSRQPEDHFSHWIKTGTENDQIARVTRLVCSKAGEIMGAWDTLLHDGSRQWWFVDEVEDDGDREWYRARAVQQCCSMACDFHRRVASPVGQYPLRLMWLVAAPHDAKSPQRQTVAGELLHPDRHNVTDPATLTLAALFRRELGAAEAIGTLDYAVWTLLHDVAEAWHLDTQEIEGSNNLVKLMSRLSPYISWELMSSRVTTKKIIASLSAEK